MKFFRIVQVLGLMAVLAACASKTAGPDAPAKDSGAAASAPAAKSETKTTAGMTCKNGKEERKLEIVAKDGGCDLMYTKGGGTKSIATARSGDAHCKAVFAKTEANLAKSGYKCE